VIDVHHSNFELGRSPLLLANGRMTRLFIGKATVKTHINLVGLYDPDEDDDDSFGAGDNDQDDTRDAQAKVMDGNAGTLLPDTPPLLDRLEVHADHTVITGLEIQLVMPVATRTTAFITGGNLQTVTPQSMDNIVQYLELTIDEGSSNEETFQVQSVTDTSFTAFFFHSHETGAALGDLPPYSVQYPGKTFWDPEGWQQLAYLPFPSSHDEAVGRVLASAYPTSWDMEDPAGSGLTTANGLQQVYGTVYDQLAGTLGDGSVIDPRQSATLTQMNPPPAQDTGSFSLGALDGLLALSVDHYIARMLGLAFCDPLSGQIIYAPDPSTRREYIPVGPWDYLVAGFWTQDPSQHGRPDYYAVTYSIYGTQRTPLSAPTGLSGSGIMQSFQPADDVSTFTATTGAVPAVGLIWDLPVDPGGSDLGLEVAAPVIFDVYRAHDNGSGSPSDTFGKINRHPVIIPQSPDPVNGGTKLPQYFYIDVGPDAASAGGFDLLSGPYDYQLVGADIFGRISPATSTAGPFTVATLPPPPPPVSVSARYLDSNDQFLTTVENAKIAAAGGPTADVVWHWPASLLQAFKADHFNVYYLPTLPAPMDATLSFAVIGTFHEVLPPGQFKVSVAPTPPNYQALAGGRLIQRGYQTTIQNLGGPIIPTTAPPIQLSPKQWLIVDAVQHGSAALTLTLQRPPDRDGSPPETEGDVPAEGACQLAYNLGNSSLWRLLPSGTLPAGALPPPPASRLLFACSPGDTTLVVENPGEPAPGTSLHIGSDVVTVADALGQTVDLQAPIRHGWPSGTPVSSIVTAAAITLGGPGPGIHRGVTRLALNAAGTPGVGIFPGRSILIGSVTGGAGTATTLAASVTPGSRTVVPASMNNIMPGSQLLIGARTSAETVIVTGTTATAFTALFTRSHASGSAVLVVDATERVMVAGLSGNVVTVSPGLFMPWPRNTPVGVADIPYDLAPLHSTFLTLGMLPAGDQITSGGYFGVSTVARSPQDGSLVEGQVSAPARITTVSYQPHVAPKPPPTRPPCAQLARVLTQAADVNGISRAIVPLPHPPSGPMAYVEVWRASDEAIFQATGTVLSLDDTCETNWALMRLANESIDRTQLPHPEGTRPPTALSAGAHAGATSVRLADATGAARYRNLVFLDSAGAHLETVTVAGTYGSGHTVPIFPSLARGYAAGQPVQIISQGMGPFTLVKKDPVPWVAGASFVDDTLHGLSDNVYFYTFVSVPVQTDVPVSDPTHQVQGAGARSVAWPVTAPYQIKPTRPPLAPASIKAVPGASPGTYNRIALAWNYDLPSGQTLFSPPDRVYTIYRTTDPSQAADVRLMPVLDQVTFTPANTVIATAIARGVKTVKPRSMAGIIPGATLAVFDSPNGVTVGIPDIVTVLRTTAGTFTANFARAHAAGARVVGGMASYVDGVTDGVTDWSVMGNQNYYYRITATDPHGNVSRPSNAVHTRAVEQLPPAAPSDLRARWLIDTATGRHKVVLYWGNPRPDLQMQLQRMDPNGILWKTVWPGIAGVWSAINASSAADLTADNTKRGLYTYRLVVRTASGYTNFSNDVTG
jgi:hypothetical protein